jgi:uncharacterized GH25 family protein
VKHLNALKLHLEGEAPAEPSSRSSANGPAGASPSRRTHAVALRLVVLILTLLTAPLRAQNAPASAPAAAGQAWIAPEKGVQLQLKRPWTPRPDVAGSGVQLYGADLTVPSPIFTVAEANKRCSWLYQLAVPVDVEKYPIAVMRYRAKNINPKSIYTLRVDCGIEKPAGVCRLFSGSEIVSDGEIHEVKKDLRDFHPTDPIALIGIGVQSGTDLPATLEVIDIRFDAPDDAPVESPGDDNAITVNVVDDQDKPIRGARVMVDLERRNFVRNGTTDDAGNVTITPKKNESDTHMLAVSAPGFAQMELLKVGADSEPEKVKLRPAKPYGGVAKVDGKPVAGAMILATLKDEATDGTQELRSYSTITDSEGRWITPPLPADTEQIALSMSHTDGASIAKVDLDPKEAIAAGVDVAKDIAKARGAMVNVAGRAVLNGNGAVTLPEGAVVRVQVRPGAPAPAAAAANADPAPSAPADALPPPNKSVVVQLRRQWNPHPDFGGPDAADIYGLTHKTAIVNGKVQESTVFTSGQPTKSVVFTYPLALPIDPAKYPTAVLRYRAKNINPTEHYTLRIDSGAGQSRKIVRVGAGEEIKADGEIHELKHDLKEDELTDPIRQICIALQCGPDAAPATLEVFEIRFDAADEKANETGDDKPLQIIVIDADDKPLKDAIVYSDYERANFSRFAPTDDKGAIAVKTAKNESGKHSITVQKPGFVAVEVMDVSADSPLTVKLTPGQAYGGVIKTDDKPAAGVMVRARSKMHVEDGQRTLYEFSTMTDEKGRWITPELPSEASLVQLTKVELHENEAAEEELDVAAAVEGAAVVKKALATGEEATRIALAKAAAAKALPKGVVGASGQPEFPLLPATKPAAAPAKAAAANEPLPAPEKAIVLDIHRPWLAGPMWDGNEPPKAYGENLDLPQPRFTVVDANAKSFWVYKPLWAIDLSRYPILKLKYRAKNTNAKDGYVLRLVQGDVLQVLKSDELVADGELHEFVKDLREMNGERKLTNIGIWVNAGEKGDATFDLAGLAFYAPDDSPVEALGKLSPQPFVIKGPDDKPVAGAKVTVDAERANFAQSGTTDADGKVSITPLTQWVNFHSVRVEKDGMYPIERKLPDLDQSPIEISLVPGARYGGIARGSDNKLLAGAMVVASGSNDLDAQTQMPARSTVLADSQGRWVTPVLPAMDGLSISITPRGGDSAIDVDLARAKADGADLWAQLSKSMAVASNTPTKSDAAPSRAPEKTSDQEKGKNKDVASASAANVDATILKVDESTIGGKINAMDGKQLTLKTDKETKSIPLADVQEISLKSSSNSNSGSGDSSKSGLSNAQIELANNDHFKGAVKKWEEKKISMTLSAAPGVTVDIPIDQARQLWLGTSDQVKKAQALNEKPGVEDIAFVAKDDQVIAVRGVSLGVEGESLKFRFNDEERKIAVNRLIGLTFGRSEDAPVDRGFRQAFQFANDDVITGNWTGLTKDTAVATMIWGDEVKLPVKQIAKIRAANGRVVYLSDLKPTQVEQVPYFDRMLGFRVDKSLNGKPLQLSEGPVAKGIAVHSRTVLHYDLGGQFDEFRCKLGFQQPEGKLGQADIRVLGDGKAIFEKADAKGDQPSSDVNVKVNGVKELVLEVDFGKNQDVGDRVVWGNARLLRAQLPQTSAASTP